MKYSVQCGAVQRGTDWYSFIFANSRENERKSMRRSQSGTLYRTTTGCTYIEAAFKCQFNRPRPIQKRRTVKSYHSWDNKIQNDCFKLSAPPEWVSGLTCHNESLEWHILLNSLWGILSINWLAYCDLEWSRPRGLEISGAFSLSVRTLTTTFGASTESNALNQTLHPPIR